MCSSRRDDCYDVIASRVIWFARVKVARKSRPSSFDAVFDDVIVVQNHSDSNGVE
jgi:hypothetical protein